ncbi:MAG: LTA synthase family protein [Clostridia bacterium]|nr:LTA synthase family protein [Clostridia bacterium]
MKKLNPTVKKVLWAVAFGLIYTLAVAIIVVCSWYMMTYNVEFKELLYTLTSPLQGTGQSTVDLIISSCVPITCVFVALYIAAVVILTVVKHPKFPKLLKIGRYFVLFLLVFALIFAIFSLRIPAYLYGIFQPTAIYEEQYIAPNSVSITANGTPKNLIYIYLESMETTYASVADGGMQDINYISGMTAMARENLSFSNKTGGKLGGFYTPTGTGWTAAALLSTTAGIPYSFPVEGDPNTVENRFSKNLVTLGDILKDKGYVNEFLCGSDATFGGRREYFTSHGDYEIFDIYTARDKGYIAHDYSVWWGYEDEILFRIAKDEALRLAAGDQPFNLTMLTVDPHHVDGYICGICEDTYEEQLPNVLTCADRQIVAFVEWCKTQDFFKDTVIVITGDHPRMDTSLVEDADSYDRTIYNCIINTDTVCNGATEGRVFTSFDIFPTTLAAMGFEIEGNRLGFGVNLFSGMQTLAESIGYEYLEDEINKHSDYYERVFAGSD